MNKLLSSKLPWTVEIDGDDLVGRNVRATCFGGAHDSGDDGKTESGIDNSGEPHAGAYPLGVALPIRSTEHATRCSPLAFAGPHIPWGTIIKVWKTDEVHAVSCILIDNGPNEALFPDHALDLNPNVALLFAPFYNPRRIANDWSDKGFSFRIVGGAKYIS